MMSIPLRMSLPAVCLLALWSSLASGAEPPVTPKDFRYEIYSGTAVELFWTRTTNVPVRGYEVTRNGESLGVFDALSYVDDTLEPRVDYEYTVTAVAASGERSGTASVALRTPRYENTILTLQREIGTLERELESLRSLLDGDYRSPVPRTGQTTSMRTGDDGDIQAGVTWPDPRFTTNVAAMDDLNENGLCDGSETCDGTVTDNLTGLTWLRNANCFGERDWAGAIDDANLLAGDGSSDCGVKDDSLPGDWRLPNVKEIQSLIDYGHSFPEPLLPAGHPFVDVQIGGIDALPSTYWTSTSTGPGSDGIYTVSMSVGWVERYALGVPDFMFYVWPVRGGR